MKDEQEKNSHTVRTIVGRSHTNYSTNNKLEKHAFFLPEIKGLSPEFFNFLANLALQMKWARAELAALQQANPNLLFLNP